MTNKHVYLQIAVQSQSWNSTIVRKLIMIKNIEFARIIACLTIDHKLRLKYSCIDKYGESGANVYRSKSVTSCECFSDGYLNILRDLGHYEVCRCPASHVNHQQTLYWPCKLRRCPALWEYISFMFLWTIDIEELSEMEKNGFRCVPINSGIALLRKHYSWKTYFIWKKTNVCMVWSSQVRYIL